MNNSPLKQLKQLALDEHRRKHPTFPDEARYIKPYKDTTANGLTRCIIDFLRFHGHQAERISVTGRYVDQSRIVSDCLGTQRRIGSGTWIPSSMQPGTADISAIIQGRSIKIEVKIGKDEQSQAQKNYQLQVEQAGGEYWICRTFEEFVKKYAQIL